MRYLFFRVALCVICYTCSGTGKVMKLKLRRRNQDDDAACVNVCRGKCGARRSRRRRRFR